MIAREGTPFIGIGLIVTILLLLAATRWDSRWLFGVGVLSGLLTMFTVFFFRDPERSSQRMAGILLSPADGKVINVELLPSYPGFSDKVVKVSIFLSVFDVHVNRIPADGKVEYVKYNPGKFFAAFEDKASALNEQTEIGIRASGQLIIVKQIAGLIARRIVCRLHDDDTVVAGARFGLIRFGSRTELFVSASSTIGVKQGDRVRGGETVLGYLSTLERDAKSTTMQGSSHE